MNVFCHRAVRHRAKHTTNILYISILHHPINTTHFSETKTRIEAARSPNGRAERENFSRRATGFSVFPFRFPSAEVGRKGKNTPNRARSDRKKRKNRSESAARNRTIRDSSDGRGRFSTISTDSEADFSSDFPPIGCGSARKRWKNIRRRLPKILSQEFAGTKKRERTADSVRSFGFRTAPESEISSKKRDFGLRTVNSFGRISRDDAKVFR